MAGHCAPNAVVAVMTIGGSASSTASVARRRISRLG